MGTVALVLPAVQVVLVYHHSVLYQAVRYHLVLALRQQVLPVVLVDAVVLVGAADLVAV